MQKLKACMCGLDALTMFEPQTLYVRPDGLQQQEDLVAAMVRHDFHDVLSYTQFLQPCGSFVIHLTLLEGVRAITLSPSPGIVRTRPMEHTEKAGQSMLALPRGPYSPLNRLTLSVQHSTSATAGALCPLCMLSHSPCTSLAYRCTNTRSPAKNLLT